MLIRPGDMKRITDLVDDVSERVFHLRGLLSVYAGLLVQNGQDEVEGEVFTQVLVNQAMAICRSATPPPGHSRDHYPDLLLHAGNLYFNGPLLHVRDYISNPHVERVGGTNRRPVNGLVGGIARVESELYSTVIASYACTQVLTDITNVLTYATVAHQLIYLKGKYNLSKPAAKVIGNCLGTSREQRLTLALKAHSKGAEARLFALERELLVARKRIPQDEVDIAAKSLRYAQGCLAIENEKADMAADPDQALHSLVITAGEEAKHQTYQRNNAVDEDAAILSLQSILDAELVLIPDDQSQGQLLRYRHDMLLCLDGLEDQEHL